MQVSSSHEAACRSLASWEGSQLPKERPTTFIDKPKAPNTASSVLTSLLNSTGVYFVSTALCAVLRAYQG